MTVEAYKKRVEELKKKNVRCMHFDFKNQQPVEYVKIEVLETEITKESFRWYGNNIKDWHKDFIFDVGCLCGMEPGSSVSEKLSMFAYLSKVELYRLFPSGNKSYTSDEYEFDAEIRSMETVSEDEVKHLNDPTKRVYKHPSQTTLLSAQLAKTGRQKAVTGAKKRCIINTLHIPKPETKLMGIHIMCFRCVPNMDNMEVRQSYLNSQNPANAVYGSQRIEHRQDDIIQPAEQSGQPDKSDTFELEMTIDSERETLKDSPAIYKLAGIILEKKIELEKFRDYIFGYNKLGKPEQIKTLVEWISKVEAINEEVANGDETVKKYFLQAWGK